MKPKKCYIYTRVSTVMQVDGYSLDAQKERLKKQAEFQELTIAGEYSDEGKSGKNVEGRPNFLQMLADIEKEKDKVDFVLVFKLSRFGRNAADVLTSLQKMQDYGVNLICVEDGIDSSKDSGKLMISVLSAVAEIERDNILIQTMEGRRQKAKEGKWNGGFAPYGYYLDNGELKIAEDEAEVIRLIFDKFIHTTMGLNAVASFLNNSGIEKKVRQNGTLTAFSTSFIQKALDNPVYCGKIAYGRRRTEKIQGKRNQFHVVEQSEYPVYDGIHEPIVSQELWDLAQSKRAQTGFRRVKTHSLDHEHKLSSIVCCPICGSGMYGNVNRKKKKDGTLYKDYFYYACKHRMKVDGHSCDYKRQWGQEKIDGAVEDLIRDLVRNEKFEKAIKEKIDAKIDTSALETEREGLQKELRKFISAKEKLGQQIDSLDVLDSLYDRKYEDMTDRLDGLYSKIDEVEGNIQEVATRIKNIQEKKINSSNVYKMLIYFDRLYEKFTDKEKKEFLGSFIERVEIFENEQSDGRLIKKIIFRFPVFFDGKEVVSIDWDKKTSVESVVLMTKTKEVLT